MSRVDITQTLQERRKKLKSIAFSLATLCLIVGCVQEPINPIEQYDMLNLKWYENYPGERRVDVDSGLIWTMAYLGADLSPGTFEKSSEWTSENILHFDLNDSGFDSEAIEVLKKMIRVLKGSQEYKVNGAIDIGRFVSLMLLSSPNYYAITGVPKNLEQFIGASQFRAKKALLLESTISITSRMIETPKPDQGLVEISFVAHEGELSADSSSFITEEFEVVDIMTNGLLRFAIYDSDGNLKLGADRTYSAGGKPSKCLWCHESIFNPSFIEQEGVLGYQSRDVFNDEVIEWNTRLEEWRESLNTEVNLFNPKQHQLAELLYLGFMQPSAERLSHEWGISESEVLEIISGLPTFDSDEHDFMTNRYSRKEVDLLAPFQTVDVSDNIRETGGYNPDFTIE